MKGQIHLGEHADLSEQMNHALLKVLPHGRIQSIPSTALEHDGSRKLVGESLGRRRSGLAGPYHRDVGTHRQLRSSGVPLPHLGVNDLRESLPCPANLDDLGCSAYVRKQCVGHPIGLVSRLLSWKSAIEIHIEEWPDAGALMSTEWVGTWVDIHHTGQPVLAFLEHFRDLVGHPNALWCIATNSGDNGHPRHTGASATKPLTNDGKLVSAGELNLDYCGHLRHVGILPQRSGFGYRVKAQDRPVADASWTTPNQI